MKRSFTLLLFLLFLAGCGGNSAPAEPDTLPEDIPLAEERAVLLPKTGPAKPISAPAVVTEGREPAENYVLPPSPPPAARYTPRYDMTDWSRGGILDILAEAPEGDAAFYALPYFEDRHETALLRWSGSMAEFDWNFVTPREFLPEMACFDIDGDGEDELIAACYSGSGTGVSIYELHVVEKNPDGTLTDYAMPDSLWQDQVPPLLEYLRTGERNFLVLGRQLVELDPEIPEWASEDRMEPSTGWIAEFCFLTNKNAVQLWGAVDLWRTTNYVASYTANVGYRDGVFTLSDFCLY